MYPIPGYSITAVSYWPSFRSHVYIAYVHKRPSSIVQPLLTHIVLAHVVIWSRPAKADTILPPLSAVHVKSSDNDWQQPSLFCCCNFVIVIILPRPWHVDWHAKYYSLTICSSWCLNIVVLWCYNVSVWILINSSIVVTQYTKYTFV